jgi:hypothetical protein
VEALHQIPEWCVYIETPARRLSSTGEPIDGFFAHLDYVNKGEHHLRLGLDIAGSALKIIPLTLRGSLPEALADMEADYRAYREKYSPINEETDRIAHEMQYGAADLAPLISLVLYLCSTNAEMCQRDTGRLRPSKPTLTKTKDGMRMFPAEKPAAWDVGFRLGAAIRHAREQEQRKPGDGTHASPRAHIRRAHWHSFWTGPKAKVGMLAPDRKLVLKWLPPMAVNVEDELETVPTIHPVQ